MKQLILFSLLLLFLVACDKDPSPPLAPIVATGNASNVENTTATVNISISDVSKTKEIGVLYSTNSTELTSTNAQKGNIENFTSGDNTVSLTGLLPGTIYYYMAFTTDGTDFIYGAINNFTTGIDYPILTTNSVTGISSTKAICGGNITSSGGGNVTTRGVCWSKNIDPLVSLLTKSVDEKGTGSFSSNITGLQPETTYYVRAYATNEKGTAYGIGVTFTTLPISLPSITTSNVIFITTSSAISGGNITSDGGVTINKQGVCWSTSSNPTISNSTTSDGKSTEVFTSSIIGLTSNTTYYLRAYATNIAGTAYGDDVSFITDKSSATITDIDGNVYHTVTIGEQTWMVENLKTTRYRNGETIPLVMDNASWATLSTGAYCDYNNTPSNSITYGKLYNWYAVNDSRNIAPTGWHVPSDDEWTILTTYLGGESVAGGKLKEIGTEHWKSPNTGATNETGFFALPGGRRGYYIDTDSNWWSTTEENSAQVWILDVNNNGRAVSRYSLEKHGGLSVRCIKDL